MAIKEWKKGEAVFRQGDWGKAMYVITGGKAGVYAAHGTPDEKKLTELTAGQMFGEMALIEVFERSATVVAEEDLTAEEIDSETLNRFLREDPGMIRRIMEHLSARLRGLTEDYHEVCKAIYEVDQTKNDRQKRNSGLRGKIKKFLGIAKSKEQKLSDGAPQDLTSPDAADDERGVTAIESYQKNQVIFRAGSEGSCMYFLAAGEVGIFLNYGEAEEKLLTRLSEGSFFGEMGLLEKLPRSATAVSLSNDTEVDVISEKDLDRLIEKCPSRSFMLLQHLSGRLRGLTEDYMKACRTLAEVLEAEEEEREIEADFRVMQAIYIAQAQSMNSWF